MWAPRYLIFIQNNTLVLYGSLFLKTGYPCAVIFDLIALSLQKWWQLWARKWRGGGTAQGARPQHFKDGCTPVRISSLCTPVVTAVGVTSASLSCQGSGPTVKQRVWPHSITAHRRMSSNAWTLPSEGLLHVLWPVRGLGKEKAEQPRWSTSHPPLLAPWEQHRPRIGPQMCTRVWHEVPLWQKLLYFLDWCLFPCCPVTKGITCVLESVGRQAVCMEMGL